MYVLHPTLSLRRRRSRLRLPRAQPDLPFQGNVGHVLTAPWSGGVSLRSVATADKQPRDDKGNQSTIWLSITPACLFSLSSRICSSVSRILSVISSLASCISA